MSATADNGVFEISLSKASPPPFRLDNEQLAFRFTATLSDRGGDRVERLPTPERLDNWLTVNEVRLTSHSATNAHVDFARHIREVIHRVGTAVAKKEVPRLSDLRHLNELSRGSQTYPELVSGILRWCTDSDDPVLAALGFITHDAITALGGSLRDHVKACENPACGGLFVDTSRGQNRRWCSMNICGNRAKKVRFRHSTAGGFTPRGQPTDGLGSASSAL